MPPHLLVSAEAPTTTTLRGATREPSRDRSAGGRVETGTGSPTAISASTATGAAPSISRGFTSISVISGWSSPIRATALMIAGQCRPVYGRAAPERAEEDLGLDGIEQLFHILVGEGGDGERHVVQRLCEDASEPEHDHRSEETVADETDDELALTLHHVLDQDTIQGHLGRGAPSLERPVALADLHLIGHAQEHQPSFGLVLYARSRPFHRHRVAQLGGGLHCLLGRMRGEAPGNGDTVGREQLLAGRLVESRRPGPQSLLYQPAPGARIIRARAHRASSACRASGAIEQPVSQDSGHWNAHGST